MFDWFKKKKDDPKAPEVLGLRLGGAFELDDLKFKLIEPELVIEGAARTQFIKAVGEVKFDQSSRLLRYYTDDDGFIQVLQEGTTDADVVEVKLFYFYDTEAIDDNAQWERVLNDRLVQSSVELEGRRFNKLWDNTRPVSVTETTWSEDGTVSTTDQFIMLYEREAGHELYEYLLLSAEEQLRGQEFDRCLVTSTANELNSNDFKIIG